MADYIIDAKGKQLGRLASEIALLLQGKKSPHYDPAVLGDYRVRVKNAKHFVVTGRKLKQKIYYRHTGYMGHLKERRLEEAIQKDPRNVLRETVRRMLPKNFLNQKRLIKLVFSDDEK